VIVTYRDFRWFDAFSLFFDDMITVAVCVSYDPVLVVVHVLENKFVMLP
jgi:hypothetical protein